MDRRAAAPAAPAEKGELTVRKATYRTLDGSVAVDVTEIVKKELAKEKPFRVDFRVLGGDLAPRVVKELVVEYLRDGKPGTVRAEDFKAINLFGAEEDNALPTVQFRKDFTLEAAPSSAWVTVHSPAYFELYVNGEKIGNDVLSPAVSKLDGQTFSLTYDVSKYLKAGENCMGLWLGIGWADGIVVRANWMASWTERPSPSAPTNRGKRDRAVDTESASGNGAISAASWSMPARPCRIGAGQGWTRRHGATPSKRRMFAWDRHNQPCLPNRLGEGIPAVSVTPIGGEGLYEIDFGTALTGWFRMKMPALEAGTTVTMTFADAKSNLEKQRLSKIGDSTWYQHFNQVSKFISAGKKDEIVENKFNYAAFRYVIIEGLSSPPAKEQRQGDARR